MAHSSTTKSRGAGTVLLLLVLFLGVAGASAFFIHNVLTGEDPVETITQALHSVTGAVSGTSDAQHAPRAGEDAAKPAASPAFLTPGATVAGGDPVTPVTPLEGSQATGDVPSGQFVVPPADAPDVFALAPTTPGPEFTDNGLAPPTYAATSPAQEGSANHLASLLVVPQETGSALSPAASATAAASTAAQAGSGTNGDAVVRPAFVDDMAAFLASHYWPRNTHPSARRSGITTATLQWANHRYGAELYGQGSLRDPRSARRAVLEYVLRPDAVGRIYALYADSFVAALRQAADTRTVGEGDQARSLTNAEKQEMFQIYGNYAAGLASALTNYAADPAMPRRVAVFAEAEKGVQEANRSYQEAMQAFEDATAAGDKTLLTATRLRMDKEAATYQKKIREREAAREALVNAMRKGKSGRDDSLLYTAFWAYRRGDDSADSLRACAKVLVDIGAKLNAAAR